VTAETQPQDLGTGTDTVITTSHGTDEERGLCHILSEDLSRALCGLRFVTEANGKPSGIHHSDDPDSNPCDGCGYPRCPRCESAKGAL
jgi:hypothetical protein